MDLQRNPLSRLSTLVFAIVCVELTRSTFAGNYNHSILRIYLFQLYEYKGFFLWVKKML